MKKDWIFLVFAISISIIIGLVSVTVAKYKWLETEEIVYSPSAFYFESDLLDTSNETYTLQDNTDNIVIVLKNHQDSLRVSKNDVVYQVQLKKDGTILSAHNKSGTITVAEKQETITFSGLSAGTYQVIATSRSPYQKTISATFVIPELNTNVQASISNASATSTLTIVTNDYQGSITITIPSGLVPDNTNPLMQGVTSGTFAINVAKNSSYELIFLKSTSGTSYNVSVSGTNITIS